MKVYVAGKFTDKEKIRGYMDELEKLGHTITHDWTSFKPTYDEDDLFMGDENQGEDMEQSAIHNIQGIRDADAVVCIMEDKKYAYRGTFTELGCAIGLKKEIILMCPEPDAICRTNCFFHHPDITRVDYWTQVLEIFDMMNTFS